MTDMRSYRSPDFLGIGFRRCASSWLHACLTEHPEIGKPPSGLHFFSKEENYRKGIGWYEEQLSKYSDRRILGEFSVSYTYPHVYERVAARIHRHYPQAKIICMVRNPVERAYSDYLRSVSRSELDKNVSFEKAIELDSDFIARGSYGQILESYFRCFSDAQLLVMFYGDLKANPGQFIRRVYDFLNVDQHYVPSLLTQNRGHAYSPKSQRVGRATRMTQRFFSRLLRGARLGFILDQMKAWGIQDAVLNLNRADPPTMRPDTRHRLQDLYHDDIELLSSLLGKNLSFWQES